MISLIHLTFTEFVDILTVKLAEWLENLFSLQHCLLIWMQVDAMYWLSNLQHLFIQCCLKLNDRSAESISQFWSNDREWIKEEAVWSSHIYYHNNLWSVISNLILFSYLILYFKSTNYIHNFPNVFLSLFAFLWSFLIYFLYINWIYCLDVQFN